jgi:hypothetical protein
MKTTLITILLLITLNSYSQTSDVMWVPDQKTLVATYNSDLSGIGFYMGGYLLTSFPAPYIYTTPVSRFNRVGLSFTNHQVGLMVGGFMQAFQDSISAKPDIWLKIHPIRILTKTKRGLDFTIGVNYMDGFRYGVGLSIPFRGIY